MLLYIVIFFFLCSDICLCKLIFCLLMDLYECLIEKEIGLYWVLIFIFVES